MFNVSIPLVGVESSALTEIPGQRHKELDNGSIA